LRCRVGCWLQVRQSTIRLLRRLPALIHILHVVNHKVSQLSFLLVFLLPIGVASRLRLVAHEASNLISGRSLDLGGNYSFSATVLRENSRRHLGFCCFVRSFTDILLGRPGLLLPGGSLSSEGHIRFSGDCPLVEMLSRLLCTFVIKKLG